MYRNHTNPAVIPVDQEVAEQLCPKCRVEMEPIEPGADGPPVQQLHLCPNCYLVMWSDQDGLHVQQGVPVKQGIDVTSEPSLENQPNWLRGKSYDC